MPKQVTELPAVSEVATSDLFLIIQGGVASRATAGQIIALVPPSSGGDGVAAIGKTGAAWAADTTTILVAGQLAFETDNVTKIKLGDGVSLYSALPYSVDGELITTLESELDALQAQVDGITELDSVAVAFALPEPAAAANVITLTNAHYAATAATTTITANFVNLKNTDPAIALTVDLPPTAVVGTQINVRIDSTQTGAVTFQNVGGVGSVAGAASWARTDPGAKIGFLCVANPGGTAAAWEVSIVDSPTFNGLVTLNAGVKAKSGTVSGTLTMAAHSGGVYTSAGAMTVPNEAGFYMTVKITNAAHTIGAGGAAQAFVVGEYVTVLCPVVGTVDAIPTVSANVALPTS